MKIFLQGEVLTASDLNANFAEGAVNTAAQYTFTNVISFSNTISANGSNGTAGYALLSGGNSSNLYWGIAGVNTAAQYTFTNVISFSNAISANGSTGAAGYSLVSNGAGGVYWAYSGAGGIDVNAQYNFANNITHSGRLIISNTITANSSNGTTGQVLSSNGTGVYWQSLTGVNTAAQYTFSNTITFNGPIISANTISANGSVGTAGYLLTSGGASHNAYWIDAATYVNTSQLSSNLSNYVTSTQLSSNLSNYATTISLSSYVTSSQLTSNLSNYARTDSGSTTFNGNVSITSNLSVSGTTTLSGNVTITGNVTTVNANNLSIVDNMIYLNSTSATANPDIGIAANYNDGTYHHTGIFRDHASGTWKVFDNYAPEPDASPYIDQTNTTFHIANFQANTIYIGNTSVTATINSTAYTGAANTANSASYIGSLPAANVVSNTQLSSNLANYQTTAGLSTNVATLTANSAAYLGTTAAANYVQNTDSRTLSGNLYFTGTNNYFSTAVYVGANVYVNTSAIFIGNASVNATVNSTVYTGTANNANYLGGYQASSFVVTGAPILEPVNANGTHTIGTFAVNASEGGVKYLTTALTGALTLNFIGNSSVTFSSLCANAQSMSFAIITTTGATGYVPTAIQIDGATTGVTVKYLYGGSFIADASATHLYNFTIIKTATTPTYTVLASQTRYA